MKTVKRGNISKKRTYFTGRIMLKPSPKKKKNGSKGRFFAEHQLKNFFWSYFMLPIKAVSNQLQLASFGPPHSG